jgi:CPA2 family monovalent cation:H+ antiporter-2
MRNTSLGEFALLLLASAVAIALLSRLRLPAVLGYLAAGLILGSNGLDFIVATEQLRMTAELGVIFLMFTVGLEFSLSKMLASRAQTLGAGSLQLGLTTMIVAACAVILLGVDWRAAIVLGGATAMSSTAITHKQLHDENALTTDYGKAALGTLLFQDFASLPFLIAVGAWSRGRPSNAPTILQALATAALIVALIAWCRPLFGALLSWIARTRSADLFLLCALLFALGTALVVQGVGLAAPSGAFLAGMMVGESDFRHRFENDVQPFRDALLGVFFVTIGMQIDISLLISMPAATLVWLLIFVLGKATIILLVARVLHWPVTVAIRVAIILAHGGEFGLLLLTQAAANGILAQRIAQPALVALAISMAAAPIIIQQHRRLARFIESIFFVHIRAGEPISRSSVEDLDHHVLLCGCGRVGRLVAVTLDTAKLSYVAIEADAARFDAAKKAGHKVIFGDASSHRMLDVAGVSRARLLVLTFDRRAAVERIVYHARVSNPQIPSLLSTIDDQTALSYIIGGISMCFPENLAAGLELAHESLRRCSFTDDEAQKVLTAVRERLHPSAAQSRAKA